MITAALLLLSFLLLAYHFYVHYGKNGRLINHIPGPPGIPIMGNILDYQGALEEMWKIFRKECNRYYPIVKIWNVFLPIVSIRHPDDLETILNNMKHIEKSFIYKILHPWFNTGLLTSGGAKWHLRRKILTPAFHFNILQQFVDVLVEEGDNMTKSLMNQKQTVVKNLVPFVSEHTLNAICETAMGTSLHGLGKFQEKYRQTVQQMGDILIHRLLRPWLYSDIVFALSPTGRKQKRSLKILHEFTNKVIKERKLYHELTNGQYLKSNNGTVVEEDVLESFGRKKKRLAMLDLLIMASLENHLTDDDIREEVDTFMFEGHDTTGMSICFTLLLLAEHKNIQDRVRREVESVIQEEEDGKKVTMSMLQNLPYLDRCIKESLRLYPTVHFISRVAAEDVNLHSYIIPSGTILHLNIYDVHRDPYFWPNPTVFDPDRFLPECSKNRHLYSYLPFSAGPRNCIGQRFAMLEMKAIIAPLVYNFYLEPVDYLKDLRITPDLVLRPAHPIRVKFIPINRKPVETDTDIIQTKETDT